MIDQAQSLNVFVPADSNKKYIHDIHYSAWKKGVKKSILLSITINSKSGNWFFRRSSKKEEIKSFDEDKKIENKSKTLDEMVAESSINDDDYDECLSCQ